MARIMTDNINLNYSPGGRPVSMRYFTQLFIVPCFSMVMDSIIIQEVKGLTKRLYFVILSRRKVHNISVGFTVHIILHGYGLHYN